MHARHVSNLIGATQPPCNPSPLRQKPISIVRWLRFGEGWWDPTARMRRRVILMQRPPSDRPPRGKTPKYIALHAESECSSSSSNGPCPMASSALMVSSTPAVASPPKLSGAPSKVLSAFTGLKSAVQFPSPATNNNSKAEWDAKTSANGYRVQCMKVWPPYDNKKFESLSYLPPLKPEQLVKEIDYLLRNGWIPCIEFDENGYIFREYHRSPGYYDGRYWTMWKLPMFGCQDSAQVVAEIEECKKAYPKAFVRVIGFDNKRQVQCISFVVFKPPLPVPH